MRDHTTIEQIRKQHAFGASFPSEAELRAMSAGRLRRLDIRNGEQEALVQKVLNEKLQTAPLNQQVYRGDIPDIRTKADEIKYQKIVDARAASKRPQDHEQEKEMNADITFEQPLVIDNEAPEVGSVQTVGLVAPVDGQPTEEVPVEVKKTEAELEAEIAALEGQQAELQAS
jgi:hypothetical protein